MPTLTEMTVKIGADLAGFNAGADKVGSKLTAMGDKAKQIGKGFTTYLTAPIAGLGVASVLAFDKQAKAVAQVEAGLKATKGAAGLMKDELLTAASEIQETSLFGDEDILQGVTAQLLTFGNVAGEEFLRAQKAAVDFATRLDGDLKSATIGLGKALNDPIKGINALGKSGVSFSEDQKAMVKSLVETNRLADAQNLILGELEAQYGGSAQAAAEAGTGPMKQLGMSIGDLSEEFGALIVDALKPMTAWLAKVVKWVSSLSPNTKKLIAIVAGLAAAMGPLLMALGGFLKILPLLKVGVLSLTTTMGPWIIAIAAVGAAVYLMIKHWDAMIGWIRGTFPSAAESFQNLWVQIKATISWVMDAVREKVATILGHLKAFWDTWGGEIMAILTFIFNTITNIFDTFFAVISGGLSAFLAIIRGDWSAAWDSMKGVIVSVWTGIKNHIINAINALIGVLPDFVKEWAGLKEITVDVGEATKTAMEETTTAVADAQKAVVPKMEKIGTGLTDQIKIPAEKARLEVDKLAIAMNDGGPLVSALSATESASLSASVAIKKNISDTITGLTTELSAEVPNIGGTLDLISTADGTSGLFSGLAGGMETALGTASNWVRDTWISDLAGSFGGAGGLVDTLSGVLNGDFAGIFAAMGPWGAALNIGLQVLTEWAPKIFAFFKDLANRIGNFFKEVGSFISGIFGSNHADQGTEGGGSTGWTPANADALDDMFNWGGLGGLSGSSSRITIVLDGRTLAEGVVPHIGGILELKGVTT